MAAAIGGVVSAVLYATCFMIPPAGMLLCLLVPFPAILLRLSIGRGMATAVTFAATGIVALVFGNQPAFYYLAQFALIAIVLPELLCKGWDGSRSIAWIISANLLLWSLAAATITFVKGVNIHQQAVETINGSFARALDMYEKSGFKGEELAMMKQSLQLIAELLVRAYPAFIVVLMILVAAFNLMLIKRFASRLPLVPQISAFTEFRNPEALVWLLIAAGFAMLVDNPVINTPALNVLVVLSVVYFLQGLAVALAVIARSAFAATFRIMLYLMLIFQPYIAIPLTAIGIFDLWGDFRTPRKQENL